MAAGPVPAAIAGIGGAPVPAAGALPGALLLGEPLGWGPIAALLCIAGALSFVLFRRASRNMRRAETVEPATGSALDTPSPVDPAPPETPAEARRPIRWWEPVLVPIIAFVVWAAVLFGLALGAGVLGGLAGYAKETGRLVAAAPRSVMGLQLIMAALYLAFLWVMRLLAGRRDPRHLGRYFPAIGKRPILRAALSGFILAIVVVLVLVGLAESGQIDDRPSPGDLVFQPRSPAQFAMTGLVFVGLAPLVEEIYFRGVLLDWLRQRLTPLLSASISALVFSLLHGRFLLHPNLEGWTVTGAIAALGLLNAWWAQRARSLRAPVAAHASYNATLLLFSVMAR